MPAISATLAEVSALLAGGRTTLVLVTAAVCVVVLFLLTRAGHKPRGTGEGGETRLSSRELRVVHSGQRDPRYPFVRDVTIITHDSSFTGKSRDISGGGMFVYTDAKLKVAQPIEVSFVLEPGHQLTLAAVVWWRREDTIGLRFDPQDRKRQGIRRWVEQQIERPQA